MSAVKPTTIATITRSALTAFLLAHPSAYFTASASPTLAGRVWLRDGATEWVLARVQPDPQPEPENPFQTPAENTDVSLMESDLLLFLSTGKLAPIPTDTEERALYLEARQELREQLRAWLDATEEGA